MKVWILTSEYNDYDQHGEYFEEVFMNKPTREQIMKVVNENEEYADYVLEGGGRQDGEYAWYWLREVECK
jgi:hypothetical protein